MKIRIIQNNTIDLIIQKHVSDAGKMFTYHLSVDLTKWLINVVVVHYAARKIISSSTADVQELYVLGAIKVNTTSVCFTKWYDMQN